MTDQPTVCYRHPNKETTLRCNRCDRPICAQCARRTPTGYRCPECIKELSRVFVTAKWYDYLTGFFTAAVLSGIASLLLNLIGGGFFFIFLIFLIGTAIGAVIAEAVRWVVGKRRAKSLFITAAAGVVAGGVIANLHILIYFFMTGEITLLISLLWPAIYIFLATTTTYVRLAGIQLSR
jgi:B-box zinc finger